MRHEFSFEVHGKDVDELHDAAQKQLANLGIPSAAYSLDVTPAVEGWGDQVTLWRAQVNGVWAS